jgi:septal ring factor EnvC (AmiA/AmiB activator)
MNKNLREALSDEENKKNTIEKQINDLSEQLIRNENRINQINSQISTNTSSIKSAFDYDPMTLLYMLGSGLGGGILTSWWQPGVSYPFSILRIICACFAIGLSLCCLCMLIYTIVSFVEYIIINNHNNNLNKQNKILQDEIEKLQDENKKLSTILNELRNQESKHTTQIITFKNRITNL